MLQLSIIHIIDTVIMHRLHPAPCSLHAWSRPLLTEAAFFTLCTLSLYAKHVVLYDGGKFVLSGGKLHSVQ